eukprot:UN22947
MECGTGVVQWINMYNRSCYKFSKWEKKCLEVFHGLCKGVQFMHEHGIAHRDLKLENFVFVDKVPKIIDFGSAIFFDLTTEVPPFHGFQKIGTRCYRSIEVEVAERPGKRQRYYEPFKNDVWCMGVSLYTMLYKRRPYTHPSFSDREWRLLVRGSYQGTEYSNTSRLYPNMSEDLVDML